MVALHLTTSFPALAEPLNRYPDRVAAVLASFAIGDGMAAEFETWSPGEIAARFGTGDFTCFVAPLAERAPSNPGKGDGRVSDDTLEVEALMRACVNHGAHLDAHAYVSAFLPELTGRAVWLPERHASLPAAARPLWWPERYAIHRNDINQLDPRQAGRGNWLNQGLAVIIWPIGAVNAGDPERAYAEAVAFGAAHTESYALEAAAVLAAAYAEALGPAPSVEGVIAAALVRAQDGTRLALESVLATVDPRDEVLVFADKARRAWLPYAGLPSDRLGQASPDTRNRTGTNIGRPSRIQAIESLPAALAALRWSRGDWRRALRAGVLYGHDAESISAVAASLVAAIGGRAVVPADLWSGSERANRRDYLVLAEEFCSAVEGILAEDTRTLARRRAAVCARP